MTKYTIHAFKDGETVQTMRISPNDYCRQGEGATAIGWQVLILDSGGRRYDPESFNQVLSFDQKPHVRF